MKTKKQLKKMNLIAGKRKQREMFIGASIAIALLVLLILIK